MVLSLQRKTIHDTSEKIFGDWNGCLWLNFPVALHQAGWETNVFMPKMRNNVVMKDASLAWLISHDPWNKPGQWNEIHNNEIPSEILGHTGEWTEECCTWQRWQNDPSTFENRVGVHDYEEPGHLTCKDGWRSWTPEIDRFLKLTGSGVHTAGGRGEPPSTTWYLWAGRTTGLPRFSQKGGRGERLPRRPDNREKGKKTTERWVRTRKEKLGQLTGKTEQEQRKMQRWPGLMLKGDKRRRLAGNRSSFFSLGRKFPPAAGR